MRIRTVVVLPAPLGPSSPRTRPGGHVEVDVAQHPAVAVALAEAGGGDRRRSVRTVYGHRTAYDSGTLYECKGSQRIATRPRRARRWSGRASAAPAPGAGAERRSAVARGDRRAPRSRSPTPTGFDAVSMRNVAARLGVGTMSLYYHVPSKEDLRGLMFDGVMARAGAAGAAAGRLARGARRRRPADARAVWLRHPWLGVEHQRALGLRAQLDAPRGAVARRGRRAAGSRADEAFAVLGAVDDYALGHVMRQIAGGRSATGTARARRVAPAMEAYWRDTIAGGRVPAARRARRGRMGGRGRRALRARAGVDPRRHRRGPRRVDSAIVPSDRDLFANFERMRREMDELFGDVFGAGGRGWDRARRVLAGRRRLLRRRPAARRGPRRARGHPRLGARAGDPRARADPRRPAAPRRLG